MAESYIRKALPSHQGQPAPAAAVMLEQASSGVKGGESGDVGARQRVRTPGSNNNGNSRTGTPK